MDGPALPLLRSIGGGQLVEISVIFWLQEFPQVGLRRLAIAVMFWLAHFLLSRLGTGSPTRERL